MKELVFSIFILGMLAYSCSSSIKASEAKQPNFDGVPSMVLLKGPADSLRQDPFQIDSLIIVDNTLEINLNYGGGCGNADFALYYTDLVLNSFPPQTVLHLSFVDEDPCRAIEFKTLKYSLQPFEEFAKNGGIYLRIAGFDQRVFYKLDKVK